MSFPNIPNITPAISVTTAQTIPLLLSSIALEELALSHIVNAEAEKIQFVLGTLPPGRTTLSPPVVTISNLLAIDSSVQRTLRDVIKKEMLLEFKFENVLDLVATLISKLLFVSNRDNNTVSIFDISTPSSPVHVGEFGGAEELNGPAGLAIIGTTLYVANQFDNTVAIYDITQPTDPIRVRNFGAGELNGPTGLAITGNTLYVANQFADTVAIYDISLPSDPIHVGEGDFGSGDVHGPYGLAITGTTLYVANQLASLSPLIFDNTVEIYDIIQPTDPVHVGEFGAANLNGPTGLAITGNTLFVSNFSNSTVERYNIFLPTDPVRVDEFGAGELSGPAGLAFIDATLYVANQFADTVTMYFYPPGPIVPPNPVRIGDFGTGKLHGPTGLAIFTVGG